MAAQPTSSIHQEQHKPDSLIAYLRIFKLIAIYSGIGIAFYSFVYWQARGWQYSLAASFSILSLIMAFFGFRLLKTYHSFWMNGLVFLGLCFACAASAVVWNHQAAYPIAFSTINILLFVMVSFVVLQGAWLLIRNIEFKTIKSRLLISFVTITVIPLLIVVIVAASSVLRATEKSAIELLTVIVNMKSTAFETWLENLEQTITREKNNLLESNILLDLVEATPGTSSYNTIRDEILDHLDHTIKTSSDVKEYLVLDQDGVAIVSTNPEHVSIHIDQVQDVHQAHTNQPHSIITENPDLGGKILIVINPILNAMNKPAGYFAGIANPEQLTQIMHEGDVLGGTGEAYLLASDLTLLTDSRVPGYTILNNKILNQGSVDAVFGKQNGSRTYKNQAGTEVLAAYRWLEDLNVAVIAEQNQSEVFTPVRGSMLLISVISLMLIAGAIFFGLSISNSIGRPLAELTSVSKNIAAGQLDLEATVLHRQDEISDLAEAFNKMTQQLRILINDLERRVQKRTAELETRNAQLIAASHLANSITSFLDTDELVQQAVNLIQEKFNLYYVGLFLLDESHTWAILKAGTGRVGRSMIDHGHRIKVGEGMIGWCIQQTRARIALQAGEDPVRLATPELPETRSEAAIPLRSRGLVIGALTIQSVHSNAFDEAMITIFQTMADQIAVAIDNALLIEQAQKAIESTRRAYGELSHRAWLEQISSKQVKAYCSEHGVAVTSRSNGSPDDNGNLCTCSSSHNEKEEIYLPIKVRGSVLGILKAQKHISSGQWSEDEKEMLSTLTEQLGSALDSARLFEETLTRAERERLIGHITSRVRETLDIETVLQTATLEMQKVLDLEEVEVRMNQDTFQE